MNAKCGPGPTKNEFVRKTQKRNRYNTPRISIKFTSGFCENPPCEKGHKHARPHVSNARARNGPEAEIALFHYTVRIFHLILNRKRVLPGRPQEALGGTL